jgi:hypothetical protein
MKESIAQIHHLNRARIISDSGDLKAWAEDIRQSDTLTDMLALATEPAPLLL